MQKMELSRLLPPAINVSFRRCVSGMNWGPNSNYRKGYYVPGTKVDPMKYYKIPDKKPGQSYGIQGTNHLLPDRGKIALRKPTRMKLEKDKVYTWCNCGQSGRQPLCDGNHNRKGMETNLKPVRFIPHEDMEVWFCNCKQSRNRPFCDGSHAKIEEDTGPAMEEILGKDAVS